MLLSTEVNSHRDPAAQKQKSIHFEMTWRSINEVIKDKLYLGSIEAAKSSRILSERRITHIISVGNEPIPAEYSASGYTHMRIPIEDVDYADLLIHLPAACRFIDQALSNNKVVLVHCVHGLSRSAAVIAAYFMWQRRRGPRLTAADAIEHVRRVREQVWINAGFMEQLVLFDVCQYNPSPNDGVYRRWRENINRHLQGLPPA